MTTLSLREVPTLPVDAGALRPGLSAAELRVVRLFCNGEPCRVEDWFRVGGDDDPDRLVIDGDCRRFDGLGAGMQGGELIVHGAVGAWLGAGMRGGVIRIKGGCGDHAGSALAGGEIHIAGDAGAWLASAAAGERVGMRGGLKTPALIHVRGSAGARAGDRLRRGTVVIDGDTGPEPAARMIAGTLVIGGRPGPGLGRGMRRGSVVLHHEPERLPATFHDGGWHSLAWLALLKAELATLDSPAARFSTRVRRYLGDRAAGGLGEVLVAEV